MAISGNNRNRRRGSGVYAGSGGTAGNQVNAGGNGSRSRTVHNGAGGTRRGGGHGAAGSQPANTFRRTSINNNGVTGLVRPEDYNFKPERLRPITGYKGPAGFFRRGSEGYGYINKQGVTATARASKARTAKLLRNPLQPRRTTGPGGGIAPNIGSAINPSQPVSPANPVDFGAYQDSDYFDQLRQARTGYESEINPYQSELEGLQAKGNITGRTLYDELYNKAQDEFGQGVLSARDAASKRGLLVSGAFDRIRTGLANDWVGQQQDLYNTKGAGRINQLQRLRDAATQRFTQSLGDLQRASSARGSSYWQDLLNNRYQEAAQYANDYDPFHGFGLGGQ
mgnify:CR=1 FL=1